MVLMFFLFRRAGKSFAMVLLDDRKEQKQNFGYTTRVTPGFRNYQLSEEKKEKERTTRPVEKGQKKDLPKKPKWNGTKQ
jgi:hypothetical protein